MGEHTCLSRQSLRQTTEIERLTLSLEEEERDTARTRIQREDETYYQQLELRSRRNVSNRCRIWRNHSIGYRTQRWRHVSVYSTKFLPVLDLLCAALCFSVLQKSLVFCLLVFLSGSRRRPRKCQARRNIFVTGNHDDLSKTSGADAHCAVALAGECVEHQVLRQRL